MENIHEIINSLSDSDIENLKNMAKDLFGEDAQADTPALAGMDIAGLGSLLGGEDERCKFIQSLKPLLSEARQKRADDAIKLLKLAGAIPALKQSGLLDGFLEGFHES